MGFVTPNWAAAARGVDVEADVLFRIGRLQMKQLRDHGVGHLVVDLLAQEDDALVEQAGIDIVAALATRRLLHNVGDQSRMWVETHVSLASLEKPPQRPKGLIAIVRQHGRARKRYDAFME